MKTKPQKSLILFSGIIFLFFALSLYRCSERPTQSYKDTPIINLKIETDDFATIGDIVYLPLYLRNDVSIGGFSLLVSWDPNVLNLHDVIRGDCIDDIDFYLGPHKPHYMFERFYFELLPSTEIHKKKMKIIGLADILDEYQGYPIKPNLSGCVLTYLKFEVKNNANLRGFFLPVNFEWDNETLDDNILTDSTGQIWYVSANPVQFPQNTTIPDVEIIRSPIFMDGGIEVVYIVSNWIGDVNLNEFSHEIADAVCFANYFITEYLCTYGLEGMDDFWYGISVEATDVNRDGITLSISDLVFIIRIILEMERPIIGNGDNKTGDTLFVGTIQNADQVTVASRSHSTIGATAFVFKHSGVVNEVKNSSRIDLKWNDQDGKLRVLLWSPEANFIPAGSKELFSFEAENVDLIKIEAADDMAHQLPCVISQ